MHCICYVAWLLLPKVCYWNVCRNIELRVTCPAPRRMPQKCGKNAHPVLPHSIRSDPCHRAVVMLLYYTVRVLVKFAYESPCEFVVGNGLVIR